MHRPDKQSKAVQPSAAMVQLASLLRPGQSIHLLKALHILTREGKLNQDSLRKLKQIYHLYQFIETELNRLAPLSPEITVADLGAGKSYLGFLIYELFFQSREKGSVVAIESRPELVKGSLLLAEQMRFDRMKFLACTVQEASLSSQLPETVDLITALHACDTATDDAIEFGLKKGAKTMVLVPCCQAYGARLMNQNKALKLAKSPLAELWRHPLHTRELGSQITNVLRCLNLQARGYQIVVTELVGWEHSMKNELIIARYTGQRVSTAKERLQVLVQEFGLQSMAERYFET
jgi:hypothetical protein